MMPPPASRDAAQSRVRAIDVVILAARANGQHADADRLTRERDRLVATWGDSGGQLGLGAA